MLTRLIYSSQTTDEFKTQDIDQILGSSRRNNTADGVTGMLCYGNGYFLQLLEGENQKVNEIYERIENDTRHRNIHMIERKDDGRRSFGDWSMGFIDINDFWTQITIREAAKMEDFKPDEMDATAAFRLLNTLKSSLSDQVMA